MYPEEHPKCRSSEPVRPRTGLVLALLCTAQFIVVLDVTIVAIALPAIQDDLRMSVAGLQWVVTAYTLVFGGLLLPAGRAGDRHGHRRLFIMGLAAFGLGSLACGLASSAAILITARVLQGGGAAVVAPTALSLLGAAFPAGQARRRAVAWWTAAAAGGGASGWVLGGLIAEGLGWRWIFLVNVPIAATAAVSARPVLVAAARARGGRLDLPGAFAGTAAFGASSLIAALSVLLLHLGGIAAARFLAKYVAAPLAPLIKYWSTPKRAARMITGVLTDGSDRTGVYYDENGKPMAGSAQVRDPAFADRVVAKT